MIHEVAITSAVVAARQELGQFLRIAREKADLTQEFVARELGYKRSQFVGNWERGVAMIPPSVLPKVAQLYQLPPKEIVSRLKLYNSAVARAEDRAVEAIFKKQA